MNGGLLSVSGATPALHHSTSSTYPLLPCPVGSTWGWAQRRRSGDRHAYRRLARIELQAVKSYEPGERKWIGSIADLGTPDT
jgi:hypothetical protein